jgi:hypothetical protein
MTSHQVAGLALGIALIGVATVARPDQGDETGFVTIFDGKGLTGWKNFGGEPDTWKVENGLLVGSNRGGGWLGTRRDYGDFVLRLEFKLASGSRSGVTLRAPADPSWTAQTGLEIPLLDEYHPRYREIPPWQRVGSIEHAAAVVPGHLRPSGQWNSLEIRAEGPRLVILLNGVRIVDDRLDAHPELEKEHPGVKRLSGRIGLQSHGGRVEFRNLRIKELASTRPVG